MKFFSALALSSLLPTAAWAWAGSESDSTGADSLLRRAETIQQTTDRYLFSITLPQFTVYRNAKSPATLDWSSDSCSYSPDNPLGFPFSPACDRHDFGYRNYKAQSRFTDDNKSKIDGNFKTEYVPFFFSLSLFLPRFIPLVSSFPFLTYPSPFSPR